MEYLKIVILPSLIIVRCVCIENHKLAVVRKAEKNISIRRIYSQRRFTFSKTSFYTFREKKKGKMEGLCGG